MSPILTHVEHLAGEIGPRGTGTPGEAAAADYVTDRLNAMGLSVECQEFRAVASQNAFAVAIDLLALIAVLIYPLGSAPARWLAAGLALVAPALLWQTIRSSNNPLRPLLPKVHSRNIIRRFKPSGQVHRRVVILAHLDTNRCRLAWQSAMAGWLEWLTWLTLAMLALPGVLYLIGAVMDGPLWPWLVSLLPAGYIVGTLVTLWLDERTPFSPGAHDNAASVGVALETGLRLLEGPLVHTEIWLAFTGAEETDHAGLYTLLRAYRAELRRAIFIGLEGAGSGEIVYLTRQGLCAHYRPDADLLALVQRTAANHAQLHVKPGVMCMEDEVGTLRRKGYCAIGIAGRDTRTGAIPYWHRPDDTPDKVSPKALERAVGFVMALLYDLDGLEGKWMAL
jgi:hypothetical protein